MSDHHSRADLSDERGLRQLVTQLGLATERLVSPFRQVGVAHAVRCKPRVNPCKWSTQENRSFEPLPQFRSSTRRSIW